MNGIGMIEMAQVDTIHGFDAMVCWQQLNANEPKVLIGKSIADGSNWMLKNDINKFIFILLNSYF